MFLGRQVGHAAEAAWWAWLGVWPIALVLSAITVAVVCFPEGRALGPGWRRVCVVVVAIGVALSLTSALWPVEYASADISLDHPLQVAGASAATTLWSAVAHPFYAACQVLWVVAVATRWRVSDPVVRRQLSVLVGATGLCAAALLVGLVTRGSPLPGLLLVPVVPLAAGWAIERISLVRVIEAEQSAGRLDGLTPRENEVLQLMAQGLSNAAICERLHLSVKTVEPAISSTFVKLGLPSGAENNRRVLAVAEYLRTSTPSGSGASTPPMTRAPGR
ncbi:hypothetical protein C7S10_04025 [Nocardioides currus]|uniref:HTH luxR-type domain-containing protein n=2 Tax=Nocardioides currus TaxID=2133958 RepID=A0A2R7Z3B0_9ACTN|nr:hypothetical protein C7S10_04025 [Nocardioides currus]